LRLAVRSAIVSDGNAFLIGLQHLDFNDQATIEEIRKINPAYANAISRDVADRGNALAEKIDAADGSDRVKISAYQWRASKLAPKVYGDKVQHTGDGGGPVRLITGVRRELDEEPR
jgi:hypothetical protein